MKEILQENIAEAWKKLGTLKDMKAKADELNKKEEEFFKNAQKLKNSQKPPTGKAKVIAAGAIVTGAVVGGAAIGVSMLTPATAPLGIAAAAMVEVSLAEIFLSLGLTGGGALLGGATTAYHVGVFTKRPLVRFGRCRCLNSRIRKMKRRARVYAYEKQSQAHQKKYGTGSLIRKKKDSSVQYVKITTEDGKTKTVPKYEAGMNMKYIGKGKNAVTKAEILEVHLDDRQEPHYLIQLEDRHEKWTDNDHIKGRMNLAPK